MSTTITVHVDGLEDRTITVDPSQVFVYAPEGVPEDGRFYALMQRAAVRLRLVSVTGLGAPPAGLLSDSLVFLPTERPGG